MNIDRQISFYDENLNSILGTNFFHRVVDFAFYTYKVEAGRATKMLKDLIYINSYMYTYIYTYTHIYAYI